MWRSFSVLILSTALAACGYEFEPVDADAPAVAPIASPAPTPVPTPGPTAAPAPAAEPIAFEGSGVIREYCVFITWNTNFAPGTTEQQIRTFANSINQRLCVDGHPAAGTVVRESGTLNGREIEFSAQFL